MIEGIFGLPGAGKTYEAVRRVVAAADRGRQCFSVTPISHPNVELITYDDVTSPYLPPGLILLDEVHLKLPSTSSLRLDPGWYAKLSQTRKEGHDLIYTSQHESKVLKQLRDNTNYGWRTAAYDLFGVKWFSARCWPMHAYGRGKPWDRYVHLASKRVFRAYDTTFALYEHEATRRRPRPLRVPTTEGK